MRFEFHDVKTGGKFNLIKEEPGFARHFFRERSDSLLTIAWNRGAYQEVFVDQQPIGLPQNHVVALMVNQSFQFSKPDTITAWQFDREFYCILDHDDEVSCSGLLFYGSKDVLPIALDEKEEERFAALLTVFLDEIDEKYNIHAEMLRTLLKRLIIKSTRLYKTQHVASEIPFQELDIIRKFNVLVEKNYRQFHKVQDYADMVHKSPKTLSNLFALYNNKSPLKIIQERLVIEAKRLLLYTEKNSNEVAAEIGFNEAAHFSRFFKNQTGMSPREFKILNDSQLRERMVNHQENRI